MLEEIMEWVNTEHPINISKFKVPEEIPGFIKIESMTMETMRNYIKLGINPVFEDDQKLI